MRDTLGVVTLAPSAARRAGTLASPPRPLYTSGGVTVPRKCPRAVASSRGLDTETWEVSMPRQYTPKEHRVCPGCGAEFLIRPSARTRYCSLACWGQSKAKPLEERQVVRNCLQCGSPFRVLPHIARRLCSLQCWGVYRSRSIADRLADRIEKTDTCWLVHRGLRRDGYAAIYRGGARGRAVGAHRVAWEIATGAPVPAGYDIAHTCDVRNCVRNDDEGVYEVGGLTYPRFGHLFLTEAAGNMADARIKRRLAAGERASGAKLTARDVAEIRRRWSPRQYTMKRLAQEFGVGWMAVWNAIHHRTWVDE